MKKNNELQQARNALALFEQWATPFRNWKLMSDVVRERYWTNEASIDLNTKRMEFEKSVKPLLDIAAGVGIDTTAVNDFLLFNDGKKETLMGVRRALQELIGKLKSGKAPESTGGNGAKTIKRRGRPKKNDGELMRTEFLALISQHSTLKDDPAELANRLGVSQRTIERWLKEEHEKYLASTSTKPASRAFTINTLKSSPANPVEDDVDDRLDREHNAQIAKRRQ